MTFLSQPARRTLFFYTKPDCPLCDHALEEIELAQKQAAFQLVEINILSDLELYERYKHAIPVGVLDGTEIFRYRTRASELVERLRQ